MKKSRNTRKKRAKVILKKDNFNIKLTYQVKQIVISKMYLAIQCVLLYNESLPAPTHIKS